MLTEKISLFHGNKDVQKLLRSFRSQCKRFSDEIGSRSYPNLEGPVQKSILKRELQKLREVGGKVVGSLAVWYGIDVEDELASISPFRTYKIADNQSKLQTDRTEGDLTWDVRTSPSGL
jgi:hypothetical protein